MKNIITTLFIIIVLINLTQCSPPNAETSNFSDIGFGNIKIENGILNLPSKELINQIVDEYKSGIRGQNNFYIKIKKLQHEGFLPLVPFTEDLSVIQKEEFVQRKKDRLQKRDIDFGLYTNRDDRDVELDLDDELISDPVLASLLNENREIIIADILYRYTELGLFYIEKDNKQVLVDYIDSKTPAEKYQLLILHNSERSTTNKPEEKIEYYSNGLTSFRLLAPDINDQFEPGYAGGSSSNVSTSGNGVFNPAEFGVCNVQSDGLYQQVFGVVEKCYDYYNDNRRVKVKFWNQNFYVFSSIGCSSRLQKREHMNVLFGTISWWEKSYAQQIRLGVNNLIFNYNFNVPMYNSQLYNYQNTFFEFKGTKYNINGQIIPNIPTSASNFNFPVDNNDNVLDITILGANAQIDNGLINQGIDALLNQAINAVNAFDVKQELIAKKAAGTLVVRTVYAAPFANSVKFIVTNQNWTSNDDNAVVHYFDFNFLLTFTSGTNYNPATQQGALNFLQSLNGATTYDNLSVDLYGAALHNNWWKGRKLLSVN